MTAGLFLFITIFLCLATHAWLAPCYLCAEPGRSRTAFAGVEPTRLHHYSVRPGRYQVVVPQPHSTHRLLPAAPEPETSSTLTAGNFLAEEAVIPGPTDANFDASHTLPGPISDLASVDSQDSVSGISAKGESQYCEIDIDKQVAVFKNNKGDIKPRKNNYSSFVRIN